MRLTSLVILGNLLAASAHCADVYLFRFAARGTDPGCGHLQLTWSDSVSILNTNPAPVTVRLIDTSDGAPVGLASADLPPNQLVSLDRVLRFPYYRSGSPSPVIFVLHLDVPSGVVLNSTSEYSLFNDCILPSDENAWGQVPLPVFTGLRPAGSPQIHLRTDLARRDSRTNVMIYNAGSRDAVARVELRRSCDGSIADAREIVVPARRVVQAQGLRKGEETCGGDLVYTRYTVVTVDQPSLTLVSTLANTRPDWYDLLGPVIDLGTSITHQVP